MVKKIFLLAITHEQNSKILLPYNPQHAMPSPLPSPSTANTLFRKSGDYVLEDGLVQVYHPSETSANDVLEKCAQAEESYARKVLGWPRSRLAKPTVFDKNITTVSGNLQTCAALFVRRIGELLERASSDRQKVLPVYPFAFVFVDGEHPSEKVTVALAVEDEETRNWMLWPCRIPVEVELGSQMDSLRMCDITTQDLVTVYGGGSPISGAELATDSIA
jgi:hypothetical protein